MCEIYSVENDSWNMMPQLNVKRANCAACIFNQRYLYVFGGDETTTTSQVFFSLCESIERLDLMSATPYWSELDLGLIYNTPLFCQLSNALQISPTTIYIFGGMT